MTREKNVHSTKSLCSFVKENCVYALPLLAHLKEGEENLSLCRASTIYDKFRVHMQEGKTRSVCSENVLHKACT